MIKCSRVDFGLKNAGALFWILEYLTGGTSSDFESLPLVPVE